MAFPETLTGVCVGAMQCCCYFFRGAIHPPPSSDISYILISILATLQHTKSNSIFHKCKVRAPPVRPRARFRNPSIQCTHSQRDRRLSVCITSTALSTIAAAKALPTNLVLKARFALAHGHTTRIRPINVRDIANTASCVKMKQTTREEKILFVAFFFGKHSGFGDYDQNYYCYPRRMCNHGIKIETKRKCRGGNEIMPGSLAQKKVQRSKRKIFARR